MHRPLQRAAIALPLRAAARRVAAAFVGVARASSREEAALEVSLFFLSGFEKVVFHEIIYIYVPSTTVFTGAGNCNILAVGVGGGIAGCLGSNCSGAGVTRATERC